MNLPRHLLDHTNVRANKGPVSLDLSIFVQNHIKALCSQTAFKIAATLNTHNIQIHKCGIIMIEDKTHTQKINNLKPILYIFMQLDIAHIELNPISIHIEFGFFFNYKSERQTLGSMVLHHPILDFHGGGTKQMCCSFLST